MQKVRVVGLLTGILDKYNVQVWSEKEGKWVPAVDTWHDPALNVLSSAFEKAEDAESAYEAIGGDSLARVVYNGEIVFGDGAEPFGAEDN